MDQKKTYKVWVSETTTYSTTVEANDSENALHQVEDLWGSHGPDAFKFEDVVEWDITDVTEIKQQKEVA